jgi:hypothetical protein
MKRVVEVQLERASLTVTYDRDALIRATAEGAPTAFLGDLRIHEVLATFEALVRPEQAADRRAREDRARDL